MKLCPECTSDSIERTSSIALRVVGCVILLFIPFGFLFCWIPFILPHTFRCNVCGYADSESGLMDVDWREREEIQAEYRQLEAKLAPMMNKWFQDETSALCKVTRGSGQFLVLMIKDKNITPYRILDYQEEEHILEVKDISSKFRVLKEYPQQGEYELSVFGEALFTEEEFVEFKENSLEKWLDNLKEDVRLLDPPVLDVQDDTLVIENNK